jgi:hypothetical protein
VTDALLVLLACTLIALPGVMGMSVVIPNRSIAERWTLGLVTGLTAAIYVSWLVSLVSLHLFWPLWLALSIAAVFSHLRSSGRRPALFLEPSTSLNTAGKYLLVVLLATAAARMVPALAHQFPPGWDPTFHCILAHKIQLTGHAISDWSPFADVPLNYPTGSHTLLALLADATGLPVERVFNFLMPFVCVLSAAVVNVLARRLTGRASVGWCAAGAYGLWAASGSLDYYIWGGLPNAIAMLFTFAAIALLLPRRRSLGAECVSALLLATVVFTHHHSMLVMGLLMFTWLVLSPLDGPRRSRFKTLLRVGVMSVVLASPALVPMAMKIMTLSSTQAARMDEPLFTPWRLIETLGEVFTIAAIAGVVISQLRARRHETHSPSHKPARRWPVHPIALRWCVVLSVVFILCGYVYRIYAQHRFGQPHVAFTPSRLLTDMSYLLAVFAGVAVVGLAQRLGLRHRGWSLAVILLLSVTLWPRINDARQSSDLPEPFVRACAWIKLNSSEQSIVLNKHPWTSYLTWRRADGTPLPVSEPIDRVEPREKQIERMKRGKEPLPPKTWIVGVRESDKGLTSEQIRWRDPSGVVVVRFWPTDAPMTTQP